ncbi:hypothetical protein BGZ49_009581, partial [Haplosporangium sp. Z 27]
MYLDCTLDLQDWSRFETFVLRSSLKSDGYFLQGVCLRLEQVEVTQSSEDIRDDAIESLFSLQASPSENVQQVVSTVLERLGTSHCAKHNSSDTKQRSKTKECGHIVPQTVRNDSPSIWDSLWHSASSATLLKSVQQARRTYKIIEYSPSQFVETRK